MYIKREDMHSAIEKDTNFGWYASDGSVVFSKSEVHEMLNTIPSADVVEVKRGEWRTVDIFSEKGYGERYYQHKECSTELYKSPYNFCPNCGARMEAE